MLKAWRWKQKKEENTEEKLSGETDQLRKRKPEEGNLCQREESISHFFLTKPCTHFFLTKPCTPLHCMAASLKSEQVCWGPVRLPHKQMIPWISFRGIPIFWKHTCRTGRLSRLIARSPCCSKLGSWARALIVVEIPESCPPHSHSYWMDT